MPKEHGTKTGQRSKINSSLLYAVKIKRLEAIWANSTLIGGCFQSQKAISMVLTKIWPEIRRFTGKTVGKRGNHKMVAYFKPLRIDCPNWKFGEENGPCSRTAEDAKPFWRLLTGWYWLVVLQRLTAGSGCFFLSLFQYRFQSSKPAQNPVTSLISAK